MLLATLLLASTFAFLEYFTPLSDFIAIKQERHETDSKHVIKDPSAKDLITNLVAIYTCKM